MNTNQISIISIEGNIGSGKSTLLKHLKASLGQNNCKVVFVDEPVALWETIKDESGKNMIEKFYENQQKYAFPFQIMAFVSRLIYLKTAIEFETLQLQQTQNNTKIVIITERSLYTDCYVFAELLKKQGMMEDVCHQIYMQLFNEFSTNYPVKTLIYIDVPPEICYERIHRRSRSGEEVIKLEYLTECNDEYRRFIYTKMPTSKLYYIDGTVDINETPDILNKWIQLVEDAIFND
jgi:deoxyadenosine/deoxycytidine kinase